MMTGRSQYTYTPDDPMAGGFSYYVDTINNEFKMFSCKVPAINSIVAYLQNKPINIDSLVSGVGIKIKIIGSDFSSIRGEILLRDVKLPQNIKSSYKKIDTSDILIWNDTVIIFYLAEFSSDIIDNYTVGTGNVYIRNIQNFQMASSTQVIKIIQAVDNIWDLSRKKKIRKFLGNKSVNGSIKFTLNNIIANNQDQRIEACINTALSQWRCYTGSWFSVSETYSSKTVSAPDDTSLIYFAKLNKAILAQATLNNREYRACNDTFAIVTDIDIICNSDAKWFFDETSTQDIPDDTYDFFSAVCHEFGHAHLIEHVADKSNVMYPKISIGNRLCAISINDKAVADSTLNIGKKIANNCPDNKLKAMQKGAKCTPILTFFEINKGVDTTSNALITLNTIAINRPVSYDVNETGNFTVPNWRPYFANLEYKFKSSGKHKLYLRVKDIKNEISNVLTDSIVYTPKESRFANLYNDNSAQSDISIYPNPTTNTIYINNSSLDLEFSCEIINLYGTRVFASNTLYKNETQIDITNLQTGIYVVITKTKNRIYYTKILKNEF